MIASYSKQQSHNVVCEKNIVLFQNDHVKVNSVKDKAKRTMSLALLCTLASRNASGWDSCVYCCVFSLIMSTQSKGINTPFSSSAPFANSITHHLFLSAAFFDIFGSLDIQKLHDVDFFFGVRFGTDFRHLYVFGKVAVLSCSPVWKRQTGQS